MTVSAEADAYFEVLNEESRKDLKLPVQNEFEAVGKLVFDGSIGGKLNGSASPPNAEVAVKLGGELSRSFSFYTAYRSREGMAGHSIATALSRVPAITDLNDVAGAFGASASSQAVGFEFAGGRGFKGEGKLKATVLLAQGAQLTISISGKIDYGSGFKVIAQPAGAGRVRAAVTLRSAKERSGELGVGFKVGLGDLAKADAKELLEKISSANKVIDEIDKGLGAAKTLLKPGDYLKKEIVKAVKDLLQAQDGADANSQNKSDLTWASLAALLGFESAAGVSRDEAAKQLAEAFADVLADLIDDAAGVFAGGGYLLSEQVLGSLRASISSSALSYIQTEVLDKVLPNLEKTLEKQTKDLDETVHKRIAAALGVEPDDLLNDTKTYLDKARGLLKKITANIEKASTDLLVGEIAAWRDRKSSFEYSFSATFDPAEPAAHETFANMIKAQPGVLESILDAKPAGVVLGEWERLKELHAEEGVRWSLALLDFSAVGSTTSISDVKIRETSTGALAYAKSEASSELKLWGEHRRTSFLSASRLWHARTEGATGEHLDPKVAPAMELSFSHDDGRLRRKEVRGLLANFVDAGMVSDDVVAALLSKFDELDQANRDWIDGSLSFSLAVPPSRIVDLLRAAHEDAGAGELIVSETIGALADAAAESIVETYYDLAYVYSDRVELRGTAPADHPMHVKTVLDYLLPNRPTETGNLISQPSVHDLAIDILTNLDFLVKNVKRRSRLFHSTSSANLKGENRIKQANLASLNDARVGILNCFRQGADIYFSQRSSTLRAEELETKQKSMTDAMRPFLKTGVPRLDVPLFGNERSPPRVVALFLALQRISSEFIDISPPLKVTLSQDGGKTGQFLSPAADDLLA